MNLRKELHLDRSRYISGVLARHGLNYLASSLGLERLASGNRLFGPAVQREKTLTQPERLRTALEELGTTFIKLGQILSTRPDLLPPEYIVELTKLQDSAPPVSFDAIQEVLLTELGQPIENVFASFNPEPIAAASIGRPRCFAGRRH